MLRPSDLSRVRGKDSGKRSETKARAEKLAGIMDKAGVPAEDREEIAAALGGMDTDALDTVAGIANVGAGEAPMVATAMLLACTSFARINRIPGGALGAEVTKALVGAAGPDLTAASAAITPGAVAELSDRVECCTSLIIAASTALALLGAQKTPGEALASILAAYVDNEGDEHFAPLRSSWEARKLAAMFEAEADPETIPESER